MKRFPRVLDDVTVRLVAAIVLVVASLALLTGAAWLYAVLAADFALRTAFGPKASPFAQVASRWLRPLVKAAPRPTAGPPKRFAAAIGAVLTAAAFVLALVGASAAVWVIGVVMVVFPALEAFVGLCVGCKLFAGLMRLGVVPEEICLDCADITRRQRATA
jgi:hypothetical protein